MPAGLREEVGVEEPPVRVSWCVKLDCIRHRLVDLSRCWVLQQRKRLHRLPFAFEGHLFVLMPCFVGCCRGVVQFASVSVD